MLQSISDCHYWQYGTGEHASRPRKILGSLAIPCRSDCGVNALIKHVVLDGRSQWVIEQNITGSGNICQINSPMLTAGKSESKMISFSLIKLNNLLYMPPYAFLCPSDHLLSFSSAQTSTDVIRKNWEDVKTFVDRVHLHVCDHADFSDIRLLLQRNDLWSSDVNRYLYEIIAKCPGCRATSLPQPSPKVSLRSLNRTFNQCVCVDHMFLANYRILHIMDTKTRFSAGMICNDMSLETSAYAVAACWLTKFWTRFVAMTLSIIKILMNMCLLLVPNLNLYLRAGIRKMCWNPSTGLFDQYISDFAVLIQMSMHV